MGSFVSFLSRNYASFNPPTATLSTGKKPLRIGVLSTANITHMSLILPARSHPGVEVAAIGGRDKKKTENFAKKFGIKKVYLGSDGNNAGYQKLLDDPEIDAVYIPLPHVHHYEWTIKALSAGKHVLVEKPIANTAEETRKMHELAEEKGLVLLEGNHPRFHPALNRVKEILESGELGAIKSVSVSQRVPKGIMDPFKPSDLALGRGATNDIGCYCIDVSRFLVFSSPAKFGDTPRMAVQSATPSLWVPSLTHLDKQVFATLTFDSSKPDVTSFFNYDLSMPMRKLLGFIPFPTWDFSVQITCDGGKIGLSDFMGPAMAHQITVEKYVQNSSGKSVERRVETAYTYADLVSQSPEFEGAPKGEVWWTNFRHQLEAFVDRIEGRPTRNWIDKEESVEQSVLIKQIYQKMKMDPRPASDYFLKTQTI